MVRTGKVQHPDEWRWCSYDELTGQRRRYRIVDRDCLLSLTGFLSMEQCSDFHRASISDRLSAARMVREPCWTEAVAVGSDEFVEMAEKTTGYRRNMERYEVTSPTGERAWAVREAGESYSADSEQESTV